MPKTTVRTALDSYNYIQDYVQYLNAVRQVIDCDPELHDRIQAEAAKYLPNKKAKDPSYQFNGAINTLDEYGKLLKTAIDQTEMDWPPAKN